MTAVETAWVISRLLDDITALTADRDAALDEVRRLKTWRDLWAAAALAATKEAGDLT